MSDLYQVSFIIEQQSFQTTPAPMTAEAARALNARLDEAHAALDPTVRRTVSAVEVVRVDPHVFSARACVDHVVGMVPSGAEDAESFPWDEPSVTHLLEQALDDTPSQRPELLQEAYALADALEAAAQGLDPADMTPHALHFTWDESSKELDDLPFVARFTAPTSHATQAHALFDALTGWVEANGYAYDSWLQSGPIETAPSMAESLAELAGTVENNDDVAWAQVLTAVADELAAAAPPAPALPPVAPARRPGPRPH
jgi:hypothetical protein